MDRKIPVSGFSRHILQPLVARIRSVDSALRRQGLGHLACGNNNLRPFSEEMAFQAQADAAAANLNLPAGVSIADACAQYGMGVPQTLEHLYQLLPTHPLVVERVKLDQYLSVPGVDGKKRSALVDRIRTLSQGGVMSNFIWATPASATKMTSLLSAVGSALGLGLGASTGDHDAGSGGDSGASDAAILLHLFLTFMDFLLPPNLSCSVPHRAFSGRFFHRVTKASVPYLGASEPPVRLLQTSDDPFHFKLLVRDDALRDTVVWELTPGRHNLFSALALFTLACRLHTGSYVGPISLCSRSVMLDPIISPPPDTVDLKGKAPGQSAPNPAATPRKHVAQLR